MIQGLERATRYGRPSPQLRIEREVICFFWTIQGLYAFNIVNRIISTFNERGRNMRLLIGTLLLLAVVLAPMRQACAVQLEFGCPDGLKNKQFIYAQKNFYNGKVQLRFMDTNGEPACCPVHLMVLLQVKGGWLCYHVCDALEGPWGRGFMDMDPDAVQSSYNPQTGLTLVIPTKWYQDGVNDFHGQVVLGINFTNPDPKKVFIK